MSISTRLPRLVATLACAATIASAVACGSRDDDFDPQDPDIVDAREKAATQVKEAVEAVAGTRAVQGVGQHDACKKGSRTYKARDEYRYRCDLEYRVVAALDATSPDEALTAADAAMADANCAATFDRDTQAARAFLAGNTDAAPTVTCERDGQDVIVQVGRSDNVALATTADNDQYGDSALGKKRLDGRAALAKARESGHQFVVFVRAANRYHYEKR